MLSFSYADVSGTTPELEVIEQITIASNYPLKLKQLITSPSDEQGKKEVKITSHNNFRNQDDTIKDKRTYNFVGEYKITFELVDKDTGASTTKTSTIKVVSQNTLTFRHSSANELGKDQEYAATDLEAEVAYKSGKTTPYKFKLRYLDDRTNIPVEGLNLFLQKTLIYILAHLIKITLLQMLMVNMNLV